MAYPNAPPWWSGFCRRLRRRVFEHGRVHFHLTDKHEVRVVGEIVRIALAPPAQVYVCANPDCRAVWVSEPLEGCPACRPIVGGPWGTVRRVVGVPDMARAVP